MNNPAVQQVIADAKALGAAALANAKDAAVTLLTALEGQGTAAVPQLGTDAVGVLKAFVPASLAQYVDPIIDSAANSALPALEAAAETGIKTGLGIAITRIEALL